MREKKKKKKTPMYIGSAKPGETKKVKKVTATGSAKPGETKKVKIPTQQSTTKKEPKPKKPKTSKYRYRSYSPTQNTEQPTKSTRTDIGKKQIEKDIKKRKEQKNKDILNKLGITRADKLQEQQLKADIIRIKQTEPGKTFDTTKTKEIEKLEEPLRKKEQDALMKTQEKLEKIES